ncbi:Ig-like domain-containing protein, partial [Methanobrevibacter sp. OttesenSCG-928-I08]|nr:Ig-like domain-containing protein [Methanobrevibacter sp. OttesenSCG-928-I08]
DVIYGETIYLNTYLTDEKNKPLENKNVDFYINDEKIGSAKTNSKGLANLTHISKDINNKKWYCQFNGDDTYAKSQSTINNLEIHKKNSKINFEVNGDKQIGSTLQLKSNLTSSGKPLDGERVIFEVNGKFIGTGITDENGIATFDYKIASKGTYIFTSEYSGNNKYLGDRAMFRTIHIDVDPIKKPTSISFKVIGDETVGSTLELSSNLTSSGKAVANEPVFFKLNGQVIGKSITNSDGIATIKYIIPNAGVFTFTTEYYGDNKYSPSRIGHSTIYIVDNNIINSNNVSGTIIL